MLTESKYKVGQDIYYMDDITGEISRRAIHAVYEMAESGYWYDIYLPYARDLRYVQEKHCFEIEEGLEAAITEPKYKVGQNVYYINKFPEIGKNAVATIAFNE